jgi:hypothetical protein
MKRCCQRLGLTCPAHDHHRADTRRTERHDLADDDSPHTGLHGHSVASSTGFMMKIRSVDNAVVVRLPGFAICRHDRPAMFTYHTRSTVALMSVASFCEVPCSPRQRHC